MLFGRTMALLVLLAPLALSQPQLTLIQDTLYKADGTRFNGSAAISWNAFESGDQASIGTQSVTIQIVNGAMRVQLVPNNAANPPNPYRVQYQSDGRSQFSETWTVPQSTTPLRVRDVRDSTAGTILPPPGQTPILESDVVGLTADLGLRPVKGIGFGTGRAAVISDVGAIETAIGNLSDCVKVDGTAGPCGDASVTPVFIDGESPGGIVDGANNGFTLANAPDPASSLALYRNGLLQKNGFDYTLTNAAIQFLAGATPQPADTLLAFYRMAATGSIGALGTGGGGDTPPTLFSQGTQVICSSTGSATSSTALTSLGSCTVPGNVLQPGDRIEIRFDYVHRGSASGFSVTVRWGGTALVQRTAGVADAMLTGQANAGVYQGGAQVSAESWGTALLVQTGLVNAPDAFSGALKIDFLAQSGADVVALRNYTVLRYPGVSHP